MDLRPVSSGPVADFLTTLNSNFDAIAASGAVDTENLADQAVTSAKLANDILMKQFIGDIVYPVGSIYISVNSTSPATLFGGTWERIEGRFLLGAGTVADETGASYTYTAGSTGGEVKHTLTLPEIPQHTHALATNINYAERAALTGVDWAISPVDRYHTSYTGEVGGSGAHNNMPPYLAVNVWVRTA